MASRTRGGTTRRRSGARASLHAPAGRLLLDAKKYGGKWVATRKGDVVAVGRTFAEVDEAVCEMGIQDEVILTRVPEAGALVL